MSDYELYSIRYRDRSNQNSKMATWQTTAYSPAHAIMSFFDAYRDHKWRPVEIARVEEDKPERDWKWESISATKGTT